MNVYKVRTQGQEWTVRARSWRDVVKKINIKDTENALTIIRLPKKVCGP